MMNEQFEVDFNGNDDNHGGKNPTPFLFVPYFANDNGNRPLPPSVASWNCPGIHINGIPYNGTLLKVGVEINLSVRIKNSGALGTGAVVRIYWSDPTTGFTPNTLRLIGQTIMYIPALTTLESPVIRFTPTSLMPAHSCLLVEVTSAMDMSSGLFNVNQDRHYAQTNINILLGQSGQKLSFEFNAGNANNEEGEYLIKIRQLQEETLKMLEKQYNAEAIHISLEEIHLRIVEPGIRKRKNQGLLINLPPKSQRLCQAIVTVPQYLEVNQFFAFEIQQVNVGAEENNIIGTIGAMVFAK
ncbi:hypothetical protein [Bacillus sp. SH8-8]|uniref:hypothetical protein n=1 Tax=Bacillus sp. SH8-8 TaxID=2217830 RepID=UPI0034D41BF4